MDDQSTDAFATPGLDYATTDTRMDMKITAGITTIVFTGRICRIHIEICGDSALIIAPCNAAAVAAKTISSAAATASAAWITTAPGQRWRVMRLRRRGNAAHQPGIQSTEDIHRLANFGNSKRDPRIR